MQINSYTKKTVEIELEGDYLGSMTTLCEFAKRYIELKKSKEGNYISWHPDKVVVDEYKAKYIKQVLNLILSFEVSLENAVKCHKNEIYDELENEEVDALLVLCEIVRRYIALKPQTEITQKVMGLVRNLENAN